MRTRPWPLWTLACLLALGVLHLAPVAQGVSAQVRQQGQAPTAGVFTPYFLTPGGGEKYLLSIVRAMQTLGYYVDLLVESSNVCQAKSCVMDLATSLRVTLDPDLFSIYVVHKEGYRIFAGPYDLFFALGNEKHPPVFAVGRINMFMCQFPFDLDRQVPPILVEAHATFDVVILNSHYSLNWYQTYSVPVYHDEHAIRKLFPRMQVLHPPVTIPWQPGMTRGVHKNIVMVGRFFSGRQSKGHPNAIRLFAELYTSLPNDTRLVMVGHPAVGMEGYVNDLRSLITNLGLADKVELVLAAPPQKVVDILKSGLVQWHLTGLGVTDDPASLEHFGISIVEGMSMGCIPVAYIGGAADIITHGHDGYIAASAERVIDYTRKIFSMSGPQQLAMQARGRMKSREFEYEAFERRFHNLLTATQRMKQDTPMAPDKLVGIRAE